MLGTAPAPPSLPVLAPQRSALLGVISAGLPHTVGMGPEQGPASWEEQVSSSVPALAAATISGSQHLLFPLKNAMEPKPVWLSR